MNVYCFPRSLIRNMLFLKFFYTLLLNLRKDFFVSLNIKAFDIKVVWRWIRSWLIYSNMFSFDHSTYYKKQKRRMSFSSRLASIDYYVNDVSLYILNKTWMSTTLLASFVIYKTRQNNSLIALSASLSTSIALPLL